MTDVESNTQRHAPRDPKIEPAHRQRGGQPLHNGTLPDGTLRFNTTLRDGTLPDGTR